MDTSYELNYTHEEAKDVIIKNANLFYNGHDTEINDLVYDELLKMINIDEPSFNVYDHIKYDTDGVTIPHRFYFRDYEKNADISSIDTEEKFNEWRKSYYILPKFDGSSTVTYFNKDSSINLILSRGDDVSGFNNTNKLTKKVNEALANRFRINNDDRPIRVMLAEAVVVKESGSRGKANGLINSKYLQEDVDNLLTLMPFDVELFDGTRLPNLYFEITDYNWFCEIRDNGEWKTEYGTVPCDGIVMYSRDLNDTKLVIKKLYYTEKKVTTITEISWDVSWTSGIFHPVANFDTVYLDGTNVSRASLSNWINVRDNGFGKGAKVTVFKANVTIPQIGDVLEPVEAKRPNCPYCGTPMERYNNDLICPNSLCHTWTYMIQDRLIDMFCDDPAFKELSEATWDMGVAPKLVKGFRNGWFEELLKPKNFLYIAGIPRVGEGKISNIAKALDGNTYTNLDNLKNDISWHLTTLQRSYLDIIVPKIEFIVNEFREFENGK